MQDYCTSMSLYTSVAFTFCLSNNEYLEPNKLSFLSSAPKHLVERSLNGDKFTSCYSTSNLNFDNSILFYLANFLFYYILFCIFYSVFYSILLYNSQFNSILYSILFYSILFYSILSCWLFYSILFCFLFCQFYHAKSQTL